MVLHRSLDQAATISHFSMHFLGICISDTIPDDGWRCDAFPSSGHFAFLLQDSSFNNWIHEIGDVALLCSTDLWTTNYLICLLKLAR